MRLRPAELKLLMKGAATFVPGAYSALSKKRTGGSDSARYCYSVWLRHLVMAHRHGLSTDPSTVAELGPGDSLGLGLAALACGSNAYSAFDAVSYAPARSNLEVLDGIVQLLKDRANIPDDAEFPEIRPRLESYSFPHDVLPESRLGKSLDQSRLSSIRRSVLDPGQPGSLIRYQAPWMGSDHLDPRSVDLIISQAVLEHVDELETAYRAMALWLRPGGYMSHTIDFRSHGYSPDWNGHWTYSRFAWWLIRGRRPWAINRVPHSGHIASMEEAGFTALTDQRDASVSDIPRSRLARGFAGLSDEDLTTSSAFIQAVLRPTVVDPR